MSYKQEEKYITNKPTKIEQIPFYFTGRNSDGHSVDSEGNITDDINAQYREIKDKYYDLLTYVDKDIENYFLATGGE